MKFVTRLVLCFTFAFSLSPIPDARGEGEESRGPLATTWEEAWARMSPFAGPHTSGGADPSTMAGKLMCGYQGWFFAEGDGSDNGWVHYGPGTFKPGTCTIDLWPNMVETSPGERYPTEFRHADGSPATVFSSYNPLTVDRHFKWMAEFGIDGVFLQRFASETRQPKSFDARNAILENVRTAANANGRTWAVMYDLSGLHAGEIESLVMNDWKCLIDRMQVTKDPAYQHQNGKPLVAIWGVGFNDSREYSLEECAALVDFLKNDPQYGGNAIMLGVPYFWREMKADALPDPQLLDLVQQADIVSPWSVGRYQPPQFANKLEKVAKPDMAWCKEKNIAYLPVIFPGFRWNNMQNLRNQLPGKEIPREKGDFFWRQGISLSQAGAEMLYVAMFDEMDEGTAIFKCSNEPPEGDFGTFEGLPSDHYLWLAGRLSAVLKRQIPPQESQPQR